MPAVTPKLGEFLVKTTHSKNIDEALNKVFSDYRDLKLKDLRETSEALEKKWGMTFEEFKTQVREGTLKKNSFSFDVEKDFWEWEEAETLRQHYEEMKRQWI